MGKSKARKTIWRTLPIADEHTSDSEESNSTLDTRIHSNYSNHQKYYNPRFNNFSSQSTPTRRYQDSEKSTRSSSTTSENKVTFNEDEYTRITTPRQDVLFKKGYLNKPKNYQTQTSTGTSTNSTGNSTGNGTPDHQSTDLDYESQFVFPNGFVDQNGIYYVNSYDPYPMMVYNPPTYFPEYSHKNKRSSTGSLTESTSPNNEEVSSQDLNQRGNDVISPDFNQVYTVYPGYYYNNGVCSAQEMVNSEYISDSNRIIKRRRRRKLSKTNTDNEDSEYTDDDGTSEEINSDNGHEKTPTREIITPSVVITSETVENIKEEDVITDAAQEEMKEEKDLVNPQALLLNGIEKSEPTLNDTNETKANLDTDHIPSEDTHSCELKPDAEEFIPRALRYQNECMQHQLQYMKMHPNLMPLQFIPHQLSDYQMPHPGGFAIPIGFVPQDPKIYVNYVPTSKAQEVENKTEDCNDETLESNESDDKTKTKEIDIKSIVSKLEEVKSQQNEITEVTVKTDVAIAKEVIVESLPERHQFRQKRFPNRYQPRNGFYAKRNDYAKPQIEYPNHSRNQFHEKEHFGFKSNENASPRHQKSIAMQNRQFHDKENFETRENTFEPKTSPRHQQIYKRKPNERDHLPPKSREQSIEKTVPHVQKQDHKWKSHNQFNSKRSHAPDSLPLQKEIKILPAPTPKYAETLKKPTTPVKQNFLPPNKEPKSDTDKKLKPENNTIGTPTKITTPTQWSTVSSRKKRKNRNVEEVDDFDFESEELKTDSEFEIYDVSLLQDVVPEEHFKEEPILGDKSIGIAQELNKLACTMPNNKEVEITNIPEVSQIEKELMEVLQTPTNEGQLLEDFSETKIAQPSKKKNKKGPQKQTAKRVIITDIDLSQTLEKQPPKKDHIEILKNNIKNAEGAKTIKTESKESKPKAEITEYVKETLEETVDKVKSKKKKKKPNKTTLSESTTTLNSEDTYDFLLDTSFSCETTEKTNIEISQELDLIIRRGMYSNLEEKIKLIKQSEDDFFSSVLSTITPREPSLEKNISYNKTPDFTKIIKHNILPKFKSTMASVDTSYELPKTTSTKNTKAKHVSEPSTSKAEVFVENPEVTTMLKNIEQGIETPKAKQGVKAAKSSKETIATLETNVELDSAASIIIKTEETMKKYPITEAVKDWMTKTRENTPEVEILKSPKTILRQFSPELNLEEEEEVLFSTSNKIWREKSVDLLECWEPEITETKENITKPETQVCENGCATKVLEGINDITKAEEELEIYESKYGQNEDFKKIQSEVGEQTEKAGFPKHGHLPYRAICCEIM